MKLHALLVSGVVGAAALGLTSFAAAALPAPAHVTLGNGVVIKVGHHGHKHHNWWHKRHHGRHHGWSPKRHHGHHGHQHHGKH